MSFLSPTWVEKAKELASAATELGKRASDIAVEAVEGLKAGQRPELVEIEGRTLVLVKQIGEGGYASDPSVKQKVKDIVAWTKELGIYCVIDWCGSESFNALNILFFWLSNISL